MLLGRLRHPAVSRHQPTMGPGADAGIFAIAPIDQIVPAFGAGAGMVRDLVDRQALPCRDLLRDLVELGARIGIGQGELAGPVELVESRAGLDRQLVEREMLGRMADRELELGAPERRRLLGRAGIDQVEGVALEIFPGDRDRIQRFLRRVHPAERFEVGIVQRLHAERDAVHPGRPEIAEAAGLDAGRIGLERDLAMGIDGPVLADRIEDRADGGALHQRGRAAAEEDRGDGASGRERRAMGDLAPEGRDIAGLVRRLVPDMAVEVAIGAFGQAERPVHIDGEAGIRGRMCRHALPPSQGGLARQAGFLRQAAASTWKARARCDRPGEPSAGMPCFSSAVISPKVLA